VIAEVGSRRFDTDAVLNKIIDKEQDAFEAFYERYRGRVYRFIVRQYGTSEFGKAAYYASWRHLVISSKSCKTGKELKLKFFRFLGQASQDTQSNRPVESQANYLPRDLEEDGKWSVVFIEKFKQLPEAMKKRFLFKHEIGLSSAAIARILEDKKRHIEKSIEEAERMLRFNMDDAGCPASISLDKLYRDSRVVKPPATWDKEILDSFTIWLKQSGRTPKPKRDEDEGPRGGLGEKIGSWVKQVKDQVARVQSKPGKKQKQSKFAISNR
jgi:DNA-directed RNA polymerase specialized sigma24 family protein